MNSASSWLDKRRSQIKLWGEDLEQKMMAAQWRSTTVDLLSFAMEPLWNKQAVPARVEEIESSAEATHLWLRPAHRWAWPKAGQFAALNLVDGEQNLSRCYSFSALDAEADRIRLSVCKVEDGLFSQQLVPKLRVGMVVKLSAAAGDFVLPRNSSALWLCAAGSGITPMLPLAEQALAEGRQVRLLSVQRGALPLLWDEWRALQQRYPAQLRCELWNTAKQGRPQVADLRRRLQTLDKAVEVFVCGTQGFRDAVEKAVKAQALPLAQLHMESFYQQAVSPQVDDNAEVVAKVRLNDGRQIPVQQGQTILQAATAAGVTMQHCCGQGVCRSCETRKVSGVVENIQTGLKQLRDGEWILPCISMPVGNVELAV